LSRNNHGNQRPVSHSTGSVNHQKKDEFASWMCSSSIEQSLWASEEYKKPLLTYIGRIYEQRVHMYRLFMQLTSAAKSFDDLDLLNQLVENTKQRQSTYRTTEKKSSYIIRLFLDAQRSLGKWEDNSRINRRVKDLRLIFEYNINYTSSNHPFTVTTTDLQQIIDRNTIRSYFDLGCGDGTITAGIGAYLGLTKENIFGGDVYEGQRKEITFVKLDEAQSTINLGNMVFLISISL
jgi:hypothetical protein